MIIAMPAEPGTLAPPRVSGSHEAQIVDQIFDPLADIGPGLNTFGDAGFTPRLARSWEWRADSLAIAFHLDPRARWHDGVPVTASDLRFTVELYRDPTVRARSAAELAIVDSVTVEDSLTAVVWYNRRQPEQFYVVAHNLRVLPEHLLRETDRALLGESDFARAPVGSGPFRFVRWDARSTIEIAADTAYHLGRPFLDRVIWTLGGDLGTALSGVVVGSADVLETLTPDAMAQLSASGTARAVEFTGLSYGYLGFNMRDPKDPARPHALFSDPALRIALTMALDRRAMLANVFDTLAYLAWGPFTRALSTADTGLAQVPFDAARADRMLDSLGWRDSNGDGIRDRGGRPLRFGTLVGAASVVRRRYAELIQAQLRPHGVQVDIEAAPPPLFGPRVLKGEFDAVINTWIIDPSPAAIRNTWVSKPPAQRGFNLQAYSNPAFDAVVDSAASEAEPARARDLYRRAYRVLVEDVPAAWLYDSRAFIAVHNRIRTAGEHADVWWRFIRLWSIPAESRIERDVAPK
jgi:peptide/nickel transport system substrate-binding protein